MSQLYKQGTPSTEWCTSGKTIPGIGGQHSPCGEPLIIIGRSSAGYPVRVCPRCDCLPKRMQ